MTVSVIVPWRPSDPFRAAAWERVQREWAGNDLFTGDDGGEPFSRAASINLAVSEHPADVYVVADADTLIDRRQVDAAVALAEYAPGLVIAFDRFAYLGEEGTQQVLDDAAGSWEPLIAWSLPDTVSSCVVASHETWETVGGFPGQFRAWGYEDVAFEVACATLAGPTRRIPGTCYHLFHPPERERPQHNLGRLNELLAARGDPELFRERMKASW